MRRISFFLLFLAAAAAARADERSAGLLRTLASRMEGLGAYEVRFAAEAGGERYEGSYTVSDDRYYLRLGQAEVFCDGRTRWEVDPIDREVVIDAVDTLSRSILTNPTRAFRFLEGDYTHRFAGEQTLLGRKCLVVELSAPSSPEQAGITVLLDATTSLPVAVRYGSGDEQVSVVIERIEPLRGMIDASMFAFERSNYPGFEVIDFR